MSDFRYGEDHLTISTALKIADGTTKGVISSKARAKIQESHQVVEAIAMGDKAVYGINTGFGPLCTTLISKEETEKLQQNILMSHAVGVGGPIPEKIAKLMLILKVHSLSQGFSGIKLETLDRIIWHIDNDCIPVVPSQGSVGASGDLAPLSHLFLTLLGMGEIYKGNETIPCAEALHSYGLESLQLAPKEGLALINGTQFIAAHSCYVVDKLHRVMMNADITGALMVEALLASVKPFAQELHQLRPFAGNEYVASVFSELLKGSEVVASHLNCTRVQDPYSLRCIPQVHGTSRTAWLHLKDLVEIEINSVTDNPIIFNQEHTISGGNFHGQPLAIPIDYACIAAAEIGNIADRRIYLSLEGDAPGVPKLLLENTGTNSGFMIPQYTTAALVSENKGLCYPSSADSIPTSLGQEDHVSMGSIGSRKALKVVQNVEKIIGIELLCANQALDFHSSLNSSQPLIAVHNFVRKKVPHFEEDQLFHQAIESCIEMVKEGELISIAEEQMDLDSIAHQKLFNTY